jgi:hypothetical protein
MEPDQPPHHDLIASALRRLGRNPAHLAGFRVLAGGISGSVVYALHWAGEALVLKTTLPGSRDSVVARARREALFYGELAAQIPLRVPDVLALANDTSGVAILLPDYLPPLPIERWTEEASLVVTEQLARLHGAYWGDAASRPQLPWLRWRRTLPLAIRRGRAVSCWDELVHQESCSGVLAASHLRAIRAGLDRLEELTAAVRALPLTLCHGDCHRENLLRTADGQFVWADWQDVHLGRGPADLVFFFERAFFDGARLSHDHVLRAYCDRLSEHAGRRVRLATLQLGASGAELLSWLLDWPPFLLQASPDRLARVLDRIQALVGRLDRVA